MCLGHDPRGKRRGHAVLQVLKQGRLSAKDQAEEVGTVVVKVEDSVQLG